jgi:hypothetical protein
MSWLIMDRRLRLMEAVGLAAAAAGAATCGAQHTEHLGWWVAGVKSLCSRLKPRLTLRALVAAGIFCLALAGLLRLVPRCSDGGGAINKRGWH